MHNPIRRILCAAGAVAMTAAMAVPLSATAHAEPAYVEPGYAEPATSPAIGWSQLGLSNEIQLLGANQPSDVEMPVPEGVTPTRLTGQIGSVVNTAGRIDVLDARGMLIANIPIPADLDTVPFDIDISAAEVIDGVAKLSFRLRDFDNTRIDSCVQPPEVTLSQLAATYSGATPAPRTVADFLPGYLDRINIQVGPEPSQEQQQAALDLVAKLTHLYRPIPVRIDVDTTSGPAPGTNLGSSRTIVIREGGQPGVAVENPNSPEAVLAITGSGPELQQQVELFADRRFGLAQNESAIVLTANQEQPQLSNIKTFEQLGMTGQVSVLGLNTMYAGFDVGTFGVGSINNATVHLKARYTPVAGGDASVLIRSGSTVLATQKLDDSGVLDITGDIPAESVTSNIGMALELRYSPNQECAPLNNRITFALDPQSTVTVTPGSRNRGGFPVLPMAFNPDFEVALDQPGHVGFAAQAINLMGQQSTVPLRPHVTTFADAATAGTGLLAVTDGSQLAAAGMTPPLLPSSSSALDVNGSPQTDVDLKGGVGVVQAFTQNDRTVLAISGNDDWALVNSSFDYIRGLPNRWASLTGDVVATGAAGDSVNLTLHEGGGMTNEYPGDGWKWWAWVSVAAGAAAVLGAVTIAFLRRRRVGN